MYYVSRVYIKKLKLINCSLLYTCDKPFIVRFRLADLFAARKFDLLISDRLYIIDCSVFKESERECG